MICQEIPSNSFCLTVLKNSVEGNPLVFNYFRLLKKFGSEGERVSIVSVEIFLSQGAKKIQGGNFLVFHQFRVSEKFG